MLTTDETVGLAEWTIDDSCLVEFIFAHQSLRKQCDDGIYEKV